MITAIATESRPHVHDHFRAGQPYEVMAGLAAVETVAVTEVTEGTSTTTTIASTYFVGKMTMHIIDPIKNQTTRRVPSDSFCTAAHLVC